MSREPIRIPIARLQTARPLARELFLRMPRNQKMIRIVNPGDDLRPALLARLQASADVEILAIPLEGDPTDAASFPLYVVDLSQTKLAEAAVEAINEHGTQNAAAPGDSASPQEGAHSSKLLVLESSTESTESRSLISSSESAESKTLISGDDSSESTTLVMGANSSESTTVVSGAAPGDTSTTKIKPATLELEPSQTFSPDEPMAQEEERLAANDEAQLEQASFTGDAADEKITQTFSPDKPAPPDETKRTFQKTKEKERELRFSKSAPKAEEDPGEESTRVAAGSLNSPAKIQVVSKRLSGVVEEFAAVAEHIEEEVRFAGSLEKAAEAFEAFSRSPDSLDSGSRDRLRQELKICLDELNTREKEGSDMPEVLRALKDSLARVATAVLSDSPAQADLPDLAALSSHFSGFVQEFQAASGGIDPQAAESLTRNLEKTAASLDRFSTGKDPQTEQAVELLRQDLTGCLEEIQTQETRGTQLASELTVVKDSITQALNALPFTSRGARAYRDTPQIAGRLATLLAYSLGYVSTSYLHDVALATSIFFTVKNGAEVDIGALPEMSRAAVAHDRAAAPMPIEDSLAIIEFLDFYFDSPDCDRTQKDFMKRTFESALSALHGGAERPINEWNVERWKNFVDKGPSISALSVCSKASSKANKTARELAGNMAA